MCLELSTKLFLSKKVSAVYLMSKPRKTGILKILVITLNWFAI